MDRLARMQAEFENTRRREVKERADAAGLRGAAGG